MINPLECFFGIKGHATLDRNQGLGYKNPSLMIDSKQGDSLYHYDLWYDPAGAQTHNLLHERQTR